MSDALSAESANN